jgi:hypothetical protein
MGENADRRMGRILRFTREGSRVIDAAKVWEYVLPKLDFPLPDFITREIDSLIGDIWSSSGSVVDFSACVEALEALQAKDILIPERRRETIVSLVFEFLEKNGFIDRIE